MRKKHDSLGYRIARVLMLAFGIAVPMAYIIRGFIHD
jgi:hypothetical protein